MASRRRNRRNEVETLELEQVLEPYNAQQGYEQAFQYDENAVYDEAYGQAVAYGEAPVYDEAALYDESAQPQYQQMEHQRYPEPGYADYLPQEEEAEGYDGADADMRFGVAVHLFDGISSLIGVFVILVLVAMLLTLINWLRTDILHSFVMLQSGIS